MTIHRYAMNARYTACGLPLNGPQKVSVANYGVGVTCSECALPAAPLMTPEQLAVMARWAELRQGMKR